VSLLKYINFDIKYSQYCDVPPPQEVFRGIRQQKRKKWNLKENKKTKRGGKKKEEICCAYFSRFKPI